MSQSSKSRTDRKGEAMTFNELYSKVLEILPHATMGEDNDGQLVIYTNLHSEPWAGADLKEFEE